MHFVYPADMLKPKIPDEMYSEEATALRNAGFSISVIALDSLSDVGAKFLPPPPIDSVIVYRGWMLSTEEYFALAKAVESAGARLLNSVENYLSCHYLPNWYPKLIGFTPETKIFSLEDDLVAQIRALGWGKYFIKDFVKSLKTSVR